MYCISRTSGRYVVQRRVVVVYFGHFCTLYCICMLSRQDLFAWNWKGWIKVRRILRFQSIKNSQRCFVCRLSTTCSDIDPSLSATNNFPGDFAWAKLVVASYIIKLIDCVIIGGTTLTFGMYLFLRNLFANNSVQILLKILNITNF